MNVKLRDTILFKVDNHAFWVDKLIKA